ncbi:hypothetical protein BpHYR1_032359 [Brachionus plicatilis]|uniref:Uncharacterized protein n=1 Tax=Brachionus plicatilis TaxID=10195 RepID=A0A3M7P8M7_BRAPC|nr:hypothetical protein BpHYR1_032359 [Brachionus plicatilis]
MNLINEVLIGLLRHGPFKKYLIILSSAVTFFIFSSNNIFSDNSYSNIIGCFQIDNRWEAAEHRFYLEISEFLSVFVLCPHLGRYFFKVVARVLRTNPFQWLVLRHCSKRKFYFGLEC